MIYSLISSRQFINHPPDEAIFDEINVNQRDDISFTTARVQNVLSSFDIHKVASPDNLPTMFFKNLSSTLSLPMSILYNKSLNERLVSLHLFLRTVIRRMLKIIEQFV